MKLSILLTLALFFGSSVQADTLRQLLERSAESKAVALTNYLDANPKATDRQAALEELVFTNKELGRHAENLELLEELLTMAKTDQNFSEVLKVSMRSYTANLSIGNREGAAKLLRELKGSIPENIAPGQDRQVAQILQQMEAQIEEPIVGETLEIAFTSVRGTEVDLAKLKGKIVLVDFWATWCVPCLEELPNLKTAYDEFHDRGFEVVGISLDRSRSDLETFLKKAEVPWPTHLQEAGQPNKIAKKYNIEGIPANFLIGPDGKIVARNLIGSDLATVVDRLLREE